MPNSIEYAEYIFRESSQRARRIAKTATSTPIGRAGLSLTLAVGVGAATGEITHQDSLDLAQVIRSNHQLSFNAPDFDPTLKVELPNIQVPVGEYETIKGIGADGKEVEITRIYGERGRRITGLIIPTDVATEEMAKKMVQYFFIPDPMPKHLNNFTFWRVKTPVNEVLNSDIVVERVIKRVISATGIVPQETYLLRKSTNGAVSGGVTGTLDFSLSPSIFTFVELRMPENLIEDSQKLFVGHERGHKEGLGDEYMYPRSDRNIGIGRPNCTRNPQFWGSQPTAFIGCMSDKDAYRPSETSIMKEYVPYFGEINSRWINESIEISPRRYNYPHLEIRSQGISSQQKLQQAVVLEKMRIPINMTIPVGVTQLRLELAPYDNDGPGIQMIYGDPFVIDTFQEIGYQITEPEMGVGNYVLLPDMTYRVRVWGSDAKTGLTWLAPEWETYKPWPHRVTPSPAEELVVHTPKRFSDKVTLETLSGNQITNDLTPTLKWNNQDKDVYYYEVQLSADPTFNTDPKTATEALYWNLVHGGVSKPLNSWTVPDNFPLQLGKTYAWRVRPRVQGDGTPVEWSVVSSFQTPASLKSVLADKDYKNGIIGPSQPDLDKFSPPRVVNHTSPLSAVYDIEGEGFKGQIFIPAKKN